MSWCGLSQWVLVDEIISGASVFVDRAGRAQQQDDRRILLLIFKVFGQRSAAG